MEPEYEGFCRACSCYSEHLRLRPVKNNNTGSLEVSMFCTECIKRFGLFPYDKNETYNALVLNPIYLKAFKNKEDEEE